MSKLFRLVDFQAYARRAGLTESEQLLVNESLFASYEPIRLWLRESDLRGPFRKLVVSFADAATSAQWAGQVSNAAGVCEVTEAVTVAALREGASNHKWVLGVVEHALSCVATSTGWRSADLENLLERLSEVEPPLVHVFEHLAKVHASSGVRCVPWLSVRAGETRLGVRVGTDDITVASKEGPLHLEDDFPLARTALRGDEYQLLGADGNVLARISIDQIP